MASALTSDQVNYLIWRYLQECGYTYSIYAFQHETKAEALHELYGHKIKQGSLISLIQRGLQYRELELQINKARSNLRIAASPLYDGEARELIGRMGEIQDGTRKENPDEVEPYFPSVSSRLTPSGVSGNGHMEVDEEDDDERASTVTATQQPPASVTNSRKHGRGEDGLNGVSSGGEKACIPDKKKRRKTAASATPAAPAPNRTDGLESTTDRATVPSSSTEEVRPITNGCSVGIQVETVTEITAADTLIVAHKEDKLNTLSWSPSAVGKLASGPQGAFARIWSIPPIAATSDREKPIPSVTLDHTTTIIKKQEVTAIQWSPDGNILATGTLDGSTRTWTPDGSPISIFSLKCCAIMSLSWNKISTILLSLDCVGGLQAWDVKAGELLQSFDSRLEVQDVAWVSEDNFAASGPAGEIIVYAAKTGDEVTRYQNKETVPVQCLAWDDIGRHLASGDAKGRITIWKDPSNPPIVVPAHDTPIRQLQWQPQPAATAAGQEGKLQQNQILASCGQSTSIGIWSYSSSTTNPTLSLIHNLSSHASSISKMAFSPDGRFIASGSYRKLYIWRVEDGFLSHIYDAISLKDNSVTNGEVNGELAKPVVSKQANGDVEMGGMEDGDADGDNDSGKGGLDLFDISEISWEFGTRRVAVAMAGIGCVIVPVAPKNQTSPQQLSPIPTTLSSTTGGKGASIIDGSVKSTSATVIAIESHKPELSNGAPVEGNISNGVAVSNPDKSTLR